jgi:hypothetical protein
MQSASPFKMIYLNQNIPFRINMIEIEIRANVSLLGPFSVLHGPAHAQMCPRVLLEVMDFEIFVPRTFDYLLVVQR